MDSHSPLLPWLTLGPALALGAALSLRGNKTTATLLTDGVEVFPKVFELLKSAKDYVRIANFIWRGDNIGRELAEHVLASADRGVQVQIEKDRVGALYEHGESSGESLFHQNLSLAEILKIQGLRLSLSAAAPKYRSYIEENAILNARLRSHRNIKVFADRMLKDHSKYFDFDGLHLMLGDTNVGDEYHHDWRTYMVALEGRDIVHRFYQRRSDAVAFDPSLPIDFIFNSDGRLEIRDLMLRQIQEAKSELSFQMAYFGDPLITGALATKAPRLGALNLIIPREADVQDSLNKRVMREIFEASDGRANIFLSPNMSHIKVVQGDRVAVNLGSANATLVSTGYTESNVHLNLPGSDFTQKLIENLDHDMKTSRRVASLQDLHYHPLLAACESLVSSLQAGKTKASVR